MFAESKGDCGENNGWLEQPMTKHEEVEALRLKHARLVERIESIDQTTVKLKRDREDLIDEAVATWAEMKEKEEE
ncbi:hypothetical protein LCGC14_2307910 [marine sediment metagenome]|uniref:Uncharacterized protein n=1 Tax=marine sediment metagenome TaxID=412755 RepID=A0A0F9CLZ6_9ZZZZ